MRKKKEQQSKKSQFIEESLKPGKITITTFEISYDPVSNDEYEKVPNSVSKQMENLYYLMQDNPEQALLDLLNLYEKYPNTPKIQNFLSAVYKKMGMDEKANEMTVNIYQKYPDYLYGKCAYAALCLQRDESERIPEIFDDKYDLKSLYPHRNIFHVSELVSFAGVMALYFIHIHDFKQASVYHNIVKEVSPDSPMLQEISYKHAKQIVKIASDSVKILKNQSPNTEHKK